MNTADGKRSEAESVVYFQAVNDGSQASGSNMYPTVPPPAYGTGGPSYGTTGAQVYHPATYDDPLAENRPLVAPVRRKSWRETCCTGLCFYAWAASCCCICSVLILGAILGSIMYGRCAIEGHEHTEHFVFDPTHVDQLSFTMDKMQLSEIEFLVSDQPNITLDVTHKAASDGGLEMLQTDTHLDGGVLSALTEGALSIWQCPRATQKWVLPRRMLDFGIAGKIVNGKATGDLGGASVRSLEVDNTNGNVKFQNVLATSTVHLSTTNGDVTLINTQAAAVTMRSQNGHLLIDSTTGGPGLYLNATHTTLNLETTNGRITVNGLSTVAGQGSLGLASTNGNIEATLHSGDASSSCPFSGEYDARTTNGKVEVNCGVCQSSADDKKHKSGRIRDGSGLLLSTSTTNGDVKITVLESC